MPSTTATLRSRAEDPLRFFQLVERVARSVLAGAPHLQAWRSRIRPGAQEVRMKVNESACQCRPSAGRSKILALGALTALALAVLPPAPASAQTIPVPTECQIDVQGPSDEPGQKDLTKFCAASGTAPYDLFAKFNWDDAFVSGNSGNTHDAC